MTDYVIVPLLLLLLLLSLFPTISKGQQNKDWIISKITSPSRVLINQCWDQTKQLCGISLTNDIITRNFVILTKDTKTFGTIDFLTNATDSNGGLESIFRAVEPEATLSFNNVDYIVGGLTSTNNFRGYRNWTTFPKNLATRQGTNVFRYQKYSITKPVAPFPWKPGTRFGLSNVSWPPKGITLAVLFTCDLHPSLSVTVYYEMYDGLPLLSKWMTVSDDGSTNSDTTLDRVTVELFAANARFGEYIEHGANHPGLDYQGATSAGTTSPHPLLHAKTDQAHGTSCRWLDDFPNSNDVIPGCPQCKDEGSSEPLLNCSYTIGPGAHVNVKESFISFRTLLLIMDSTNLRRQTLSKHRVSQVLTPHTTENPIFFHATNVSVSGFINIINQMNEVGFEMLIFSFGSGFNLETDNSTYINNIKKQVDYAKSKNIEVGGYDLICLDRGHGGYGGNVGDQWVTVDPLTGKLKADACFASGWYDKLHQLIIHFINNTGLSMLETDGPYGGGSCASKNHSHHHGLEDSVYRQTQLQNAFYNEMRKLNVCKFYLVYYYSTITIYILTKGWDTYFYSKT
jgi:hypothetical protein